MEPPRIPVLADRRDGAALPGAVALTPVLGAGDAPEPLLVLAVLGGLLVLVLLLWALARFFAYDPEWLRATRHAIAEAGWRTGGAWDDFRDWLRGGRGASSR